MNSNKPVDLAQKIQYLKEKIDEFHWECKRSDDFMFRLKFQDFIDGSIESILKIKNNDKKNQSVGNFSSGTGRIYQSENGQLEREKKIANHQNNQINMRQKNLQLENLSIKLQNKEFEVETLKKKHDEEKDKLKIKCDDLNQKNKFYEKQIEKLTQLNARQDEEIKKVKEERNRAQKNQLQMKEKYEKDFGQVQKFQEKDPKYFDRSSDGLKCTRMFQNISKDKPGQQKKIIILHLPATVEINKIVYGIMIGIQENSTDIVYYDKLQLYEKQITQIHRQGNSLLIRFPRRKSNNEMVLDKYKVKHSQIIIMLYGKGDSIYIHQ